MEILTLQPNQEDAGKRIDAWLAANLEELTRSAAQRLLEEGKVTKEGKALAKNYKLTGGETLEVALPDPEPVDVVPQNIPLDIVFEDGDVIVVNKPKGLVVHPAPAIPTAPWSTPFCTTAGTPSPASTGSCAPASSTASTGTPPASSSPPRTMFPTRNWRPSCRTTRWPVFTTVSSPAICGRTPAPSTPPLAATIPTAKKWPSWRTDAMP